MCSNPALSKYFLNAGSCYELIIYHYKTFRVGFWNKRAHARAHIFCARAYFVFFCVFGGFCRFSQKIVCEPHVLVEYRLFCYEVATKRHQQLAITLTMNGVTAI